MTTIHVTIDDHAEALGVVAFLNNKGYTVRIDLDVVAEPDESLQDVINQAHLLRMEADEVAIRERLWGRGSQAEANMAAAKDRALRKAEREYRKAIEATGGATMIAQTHVVAEQRAEREERQMRYDARVMEVRRSLNYKCPKCSAGVGHPCTMSSGRPYSNWSHVDRIGMWHDNNTPAAF